VSFGAAIQKVLRISGMGLTRGVELPFADNVRDFNAVQCCQG